MKIITWNPNDKHSDVRLKNNNLTIDGKIGTGYGGIKAIKQDSKFSFYFEVKIDRLSTRILVGVADNSIDTSISYGTSATALPNGIKGLMSSGFTYSPEIQANKPFSTGDVIGVAYSHRERKLTFYKNGNLYHTMSNLTDSIWTPYICVNSETEVVTGIFSKNNFYYPVPSGYTPYQRYDNKSLILHNGEYKKWNSKTPPIDGISFLPVFNSNNQYGMTISASDYSGTNDAYKAVDRNMATSWVSNVAPTASKPCWWKIDLGSIKEITGYSLISYSGTAIRSHYLQVSDNGVDFSTVYSHENMIISDTKVNIKFNKVSSRYIRVLITTPWNSSSQVSIKELELIDAGTVAKDGYWENISNTLPDSNTFKEKGMNSLLVLNRDVSTLTNIPMADKSEILNGEDGKVFSKTIDLKKYFDIRNIRTEVK